MIIIVASDFKSLRTNFRFSADVGHFQKLFQLNSGQHPKIAVRPYSQSKFMFNFYIFHFQHQFERKQTFVDTVFIWIWNDRSFQCYKLLVLIWKNPDTSCIGELWREIRVSGFANHPKNPIITLVVGLSYHLHWEIGLPLSPLCAVFGIIPTWYLRKNLIWYLTRDA